LNGKRQRFKVNCLLKVGEGVEEALNDDNGGRTVSPGESLSSVKVGKVP